MKKIGLIGIICFFIVFDLVNNVRADQYFYGFSNRSAPAITACVVATGASVNSFTHNSLAGSDLTFGSDGCLHTVEQGAGNVQAYDVLSGAVVNSFSSEFGSSWNSIFSNPLQFPNPPPCSCYVLVWMALWASGGC